MPYNVPLVEQLREKITNLITTEEECTNNTLYIFMHENVLSGNFSVFVEQNLICKIEC